MQFTEIGYTKKTYGVNGELKVHIEDRYLEDFLAAGVVFLEVGGGKAPFFLEQVRETNALVVKFEEVDTPEEATPLTGRALYLRQEDLLAEETGDEPASGFFRYEGFTVIDRHAGTVGVIEEVVEFPQQIMAIIPVKGREILIPLHDAFILAVRESARILEMDLPEGLLEL